MTIHGFQKMTLLDYPGKVACTVFTAGCNLRCPFCHNALLVTRPDPAAAFDPEEILAYLKKRVGLLDGVCVTGGEPLLQPDIGDFLLRIKEMGFAVKVDTNGTLPDRLRRLVESGAVDTVAVDIKNRREKYPLTVGLPDFDVAPVEETVRYLLSGAVDYEFRTTVVAELHTPEDIDAIGAWISGAPRYYLQNFVDSGELIGEGLHAHPKEILEQMRAIAARHIPTVELRGV